MDRSWIQSKARNKLEYINGVTNFIKFATDHMKPGYRQFSKLSFLVKLLYLKTVNRWSNKSFTMLLELLKEAFPESETLPTKLMTLHLNKIFVYGLRCYGQLMTFRHIKICLVGVQKGS
ncbi:hypothetical protein ACOSP7_026740 [Xanthoceras sorbifolium]